MRLYSWIGAEAVHRLYTVPAAITLALVPGRLYWDQCCGGAAAVNQLPLLPLSSLLS